jgi:hypothetical protein
MIIQFPAVRLIYYQCLRKLHEADSNTDPGIRPRNACIIVTPQQEEGVILLACIDLVLVENVAPELDL